MMRNNMTDSTSIKRTSITEYRCYLRPLYTQHTVYTGYIKLWGRQMQMTIPPPGTPEVEKIEIVKTA